MACFLFSKGFISAFCCRDASVVEMEKLVKEISAFHGGDDSFGRKVWNVKEAALGFIEVANEAMCRAVRSITQVFISVFNIV